MKKVVTINLGGNAWQFDEDGYAEVESYLENARLRLADNPDIDEIMSDLELAIADKANRFLSSSKTVITGSEVTQILEEMGPVDMPPGEGGHTTGSAAGDEFDTAGAQARPDGGTDGASRRRQHKLYRLVDPGDRMISGICAGMAAYFGVDVSILRIVVIVLTFMTGGMAALAYLLLILIIPAAKTAEQRAAAYGVPFDAQDVIYSAREKISELSESGRTHWRQRAAARHQAGASRGVWHEAFRWVLIAIIAVIGIVVSLSLLVGFFRMLGFPLGLFGPVYFGGPPWFGLLIATMVLTLILWVFSSRSREGSSLLASFMVAFAIVCLIWFATHAFGFVARMADGAQHLIPYWLV